MVGLLVHVRIINDRRWRVFCSLVEKIEMLSWLVAYVVLFCFIAIEILTFRSEQLMWTTRWLVVIHALDIKVKFPIAQVQSLGCYVIWTLAFMVRFRISLLKFESLIKLLCLTLFLLKAADI